MTLPLQSLATAFGVNLDTDGLKALATKANVMRVPSGARLFASGDVCENFVVIIEGTAKVQLCTRTGREVILFRLSSGQSCALTTSCILTESPYYAEGIAETDLQILTLPASEFVDCLKQEPQLFITLLSNYAQRIGELTGVIDRLMSRDLNAELKDLLLERSDSEGNVYLSHQMIADELASSREVMSRKLKTLEKAGRVSLSRGCVTLINLN